MTDRELLQQIVNAWEHGSEIGIVNAIEAIRTRLAQPESKVFGWLEIDDISEECFVQLEEKPDWGGEWIPLYTAPQKKEWVGLTDEEVKILTTQNRTDFSRPPYEEFYRAIEAKLKEKNG